MAVVIQRFEPGTLQAKVQARTAYAMYRGAIHRIPTRFELVEQAGVNFVIRIVSNLSGKVQAKVDQRHPSKTAKMDQDPFLPYDQDLFVADISDTHLCLLNKFTVLNHHILMVTRSFQEQESFLTLSDFEGVLLCLNELEGLVFYNAGKAAGASQRHKHLQMVPLSFTSEVPQLPIEPLLKTARFGEMIGKVPGFPFTHGLLRMNSEWIVSPLNGAQELLKLYLHMLRVLGVSDGGTGGETRSPGPYNLLVTREWMLLIPRSTECFEDISVNALGFAGGFLVKNESELDRLKTCGPMTALCQVGWC